MKDVTLSAEKTPDFGCQPIEATLDAGAQNCATLIMNVRQEMASLSAEDILAVVAYDPSAELDLQAWTRMTGHVYLGMKRSEQFAIHYLKK